MPSVAGRNAEAYVRAVFRTFLIAVAIVALVVGCSGAKTKAGAGEARVLRLTMMAPDGSDPGAALFADEVKRRTHGRIQIVVDGDSYDSLDPNNELRLVKALRAGTVSLAYVPARAWERDGIDGFRALQAPFLIDSYPLLRRIVEGPVGKQMLEQLDQVGLVGLGLVPDELRRPLGRTPLTSAAAFKGTKIRVVTSLMSIRDLHALGAVPLTHFTSRQVVPALENGTLDAVESDAHSIESNEYEAIAHYLPSNLTLFAKAQTIVVRKSVLSTLSRQDENALRAAATAAVTRVDPAAQERAEIGRMCAERLRLVTATKHGLVSLRTASAAVYRALDDDSLTRSEITRIEALKRALPSGSADLPRCEPRQAGPGRSNVSFPQGVYQSRITAADFARGHTNYDPSFPTPWRITIRGGHWQTNESPPYGGTYVVTGNQITFVIDHPSDSAGTRETVSWSYFRGLLTLNVVSVADSGSRVIYTAHPWHRTAS